MKFNDQGRKSLIEGVLGVCDVILSTMGPMGRKVCIPDSKGAPTFSRDGVTVSMGLVSPYTTVDGESWKYKNMGARLLTDACSKTVKAGGDGTTTTAALVKGLIEAITDLSGSEFETNRIVAELREKVKVIHDAIDGMSRKPSKEELLNLTVVSANNNYKLGKMISDLVWELGEDAYIEPVPQMGDTKTEIIKGYDLGSGFMIPQYKSLDENAFSENIRKTGDHVWLKNPYVMLIEEEITKYQSLLPVYKAFKKTMKVDKGGRKYYPNALVIIAADVSEDALQFVVQNLFPMKATDVPVPVFLLKSPDQGMARYEAMKDIQVAVGSRMVFSKYQGRRLDHFAGVEDFGTCLRAEVTMGNCRMILSKANDAAVDARIEAIKTEVKDSAVANKRIGKLSKGIGLIYIGGYTDVEYNYNNQVIEDAVLGSLSALKHGVVSGAGRALIKACESLDTEDDSTEILTSACLIPAMQILVNAGYGGDQIAEILSMGKVFNVLTAGYEEEDETSILDSAEVCKSALLHAVSLAGEIIQSKFAISL